MRKVLKYFKPYILPIFLVAVLLFVQAMNDLNLPNLMSKIVDVGISQNGIENPLPDAISSSGYNMAAKLMNEKEKENFSLVYKKHSGNDSHIKNRYNISSDEDVYILDKNISENDEKYIMAEKSYTQSIAALTQILKSSMNKNGLSDSTVSETQSREINNDDLKKLYQMSAMLDLNNPEIKSAYDEALKQDELMKKQISIFMTKMFYQEIGIEIGEIQTAYILKIGLIMLLLTLFGAAAAVGTGYLSAVISSKAARRMRFDVFKKVESFSLEDLDRFSTASLITRTTNDVTQVQMFSMMAMRMIASAPIMGIGGIIMALRKSVSMSWIIALALILIISLIGTIFVIVMPKFKIAQKLIDRLNLVARENLSGMMVIRAFGTQKFEEDRFDKSNKDLTKNQLFVNRIMTFMMPAMMFIMNLITIIIVWVGAKQIEQSVIQIGDMMAFMQYAMQIVMSFVMISMMFIMAPRASVSGNRIAEVLEVEPSVKTPEKPAGLGKISGDVEFDNVSFRYANAQEDVLSNISFKAKKGETTAFIGATGSGKSTLINLIPRFYDVTGGAVKIDGINIKDMDLHELRENIGYVPQKGVLFSGDVNSNISYGVDNIDEDRIRQAAAVAQAEEFINQMPDKYETDISQGGNNVSGGQKQRLSIARALAKKPPIFIFDDSFSALDFKTDAKLRRALKEYTNQACVLIVAQRVSTIMHAQQIIVLDEGKIVGKGTHSYLLENCEQYREIAQSQLSKEELE